MLLVCLPLLRAQTPDPDAVPPPPENPASIYQGPDLMGRGSLKVGKVGDGSTPMAAEMYVNGTHDSLIGGFAVDQNGDPIQGASYGVEGGFNASGQRQMRRSVLGLLYNGSYNYYERLPQFNGTNQALTLGYATRLSKRWELVSNSVGSYTNRVIGNPLNMQAGAAENLYLPLNELFDTGIYFAQTDMELSYAKSARWQYQARGNGGVVRRKAKGLADVNLYGGGAGATYRWNRRTSIGLNYTFNHFDYGRSFGESDIHGVTFGIGRQIGRNWQLEARVSGYQQDTIGVRQVELDPVIAALLGRGTGSEAFTSHSFLYGYFAKLTRRFRGSEFDVRSERAIRPGNGLYYSTITQMHGARYDLRLGPVWTVTAGAGYDNMKNLGGAALGAMQNVYGMTEVSRRLTRDLRLRIVGEARKFEIQNTRFERAGHRFVVGLSYSPEGIFR